MQFEYFHFIDETLNMEEFKNIIKDCSCELEFGGILICKYDFNILIELNPIQQDRNTFIIKIPEFLVYEIAMIPLYDDQVLLNFNMNYSFQKIAIINKNVIICFHMR